MHIKCSSIVLTIVLQKNKHYLPDYRSLLSQYKVAWLLLLAFAMLVSCRDQRNDSEDMMPAIRIRILNGCGFRNAASDFRNYIIRYNVDVIGVGNADKFIYNRSIIVVKREDPQDLERLMRYTGISRRVYALDSQTDESFQIILGKDFRDYMN